MINLIIAVLAAWRLTELFSLDAGPGQLLARLRAKFPLFLSCGRCVSIWAGILCTVVYHYYPLLNLPFAISQTYLMSIVAVSLLSKKDRPKGRELSISLDENGTIALNRNEWTPDELKSLSKMIG